MALISGLASFARRALVLGLGIVIDFLLRALDLLGCNFLFVIEFPFKDLSVHLSAFELILRAWVSVVN